MKVPKILRKKRTLVIALAVVTVTIVVGVTIYRNYVVQQRIGTFQVTMKERQDKFNGLATRSDKYKDLQKLQTEYSKYKDSGDCIDEITAVYNTQIADMQDYFVNDYQATLEALTESVSAGETDEMKLTDYLEQLKDLEKQIKEEQSVVGITNKSKALVTNIKELETSYHKQIVAIQVEQLIEINDKKSEIREQVDNFELEEEHRVQLEELQNLLAEYTAYQEEEENEEINLIYEESILSMRTYIKEEYDQTIEENTLADVEQSKDKSELSKAQANLETLLITIKDEEEVVTTSDEVIAYDTKIKALTASYEDRIQVIVRAEEAQRQQQAAALKASQAAAGASVSSDYLSDGTLFIGNSRTEFLALYSGWTGTEFWYRGGITIWEIMNTPIVWNGSSKITVSQALSNNQYKHIYIMLGVNEWGTNSDQGFANQYQKVLTEIAAKQPNATIYIESIVHVSQAKDASWGNRANAAINRRNALLKKLAVGGRTHYIDFNQYLDDGTGALDSSHTWDGVHFVTAMVNTWKNIVLSNIQ